MLTSRRRALAARSRAGAALLAAVAATACTSRCRGAPERAAAPAPIRIAAPYDASTLDPHAENRLGTFSILTNVYEPLVVGDADMRIHPLLAVSWQSPDPLTWLFRLRSGVRFHDGRALTAADVVYTLNRVLRATDLEMRSYLLDVAEVRAMDDLTVEIRTMRPSRILLNKLSAILIVPEGSTTDSLRAIAAGTGPYVVRSWRGGENVRLERNEAYWGGPPPVPSIEFVLGQSPAEAAQGLREGRYELAQLDARAAAPLERDARFRVLRRDNLYVKYLGFDLWRDRPVAVSASRNPFRDRAVREAIHLALDRRWIVENVDRQGLPATQPIPRFVFGFDPGISVPAPDLERARALMRSAGYGDGLRAVLFSRRIFGTATDLVAAQLARAGIEVEPRALPDGEFFDALDEGEASLWLTRFACSSGDASDLLDDLVHSPDRARHYGDKNYGRFSDPALDAAIEKAAAIEDPDDRGAALRSIMRTVMERLVVVPVYADQDVYAISAGLAWSPRSDSYIRGIDILPAR